MKEQKLTLIPKTATLTDPFLDFTASRGNNLRSIGLTAGCKWCLCAARWKEALSYANSEEGKAKEGIVPKVHLHATHERALDVVDLQELRRHAAEGEVGNARYVMFCVDVRKWEADKWQYGCAEYGWWGK
jgi:uncharacterized protein (DUF2237 family)